MRLTHPHTRLSHTRPALARAAQEGRSGRRASRRLVAVVAWTGLTLLVVIGSLLGSTVLAHAAAAPTAGIPIAGMTEAVALAGSVEELLTNIRTWIVGVLAALATVFLTIGGVRYVMGGGDPGEIEKAKSAFRSAGFGYALAALAPLVVEVLKGIVGA